MERRAVDRVRGTQDCWPPEARQIEAVRRRVEASFCAFGYQRIDVPVLEPAELHLRKSGSDIISKLYALTDQSGRRLCLRPELTASVVRAYIGQPALRLPVKVFSSGPVFRYERPSRGRFRQFSHAGVELIGAEGPLADAEVVALAMHSLDTLGLREYQVTVGHVGIIGELLARLGVTGRLRSFLLESLEEARRHGVDAVRKRLRALDPELFEPAGEVDGAERALSLDGSLDDDQVRATVARLLAEMGAEALGRRGAAEVVDRMLRKLHPRSGREAVERALGFVERLGETRGAPAEVLRVGRELLGSYGLVEEPLQELRDLVALLDRFGADPARVQLDLGLSRGLQYYTGMVFEIDHAGLGSESQLCGGGRYDDLIRSLGGRQSVPALGFAFGVERVKLALEAEEKLPRLAPVADVFVTAAAPDQTGYAAQVARALRQAGWSVHLEVMQRPLRASLAYADREGFAHVAVVGDAEARDGTVRLRAMGDGSERLVALSRLDEIRYGAVTEQSSSVVAISRPPVGAPARPAGGPHGAHRGSDPSGAGPADGPAPTEMRERVDRGDAGGP